MRQDGGEPECNESQEDAGLGNKKASVNNLPKFGNEILKKPRSANTKIPDAKYESGRALGKNAGNKKKQKKQKHSTRRHRKPREHARGNETGRTDKDRREHTDFIYIQGLIDK